MSSRRSKSRGDRNSRRIAVWGNVVALAAVVTLAVGIAQPQTSLGRTGREHSRAEGLSPALARLADRATASPSDDQELRVIVQFKQRPQSQHFQRVTGRGGKLHADLGVINGGAFSLHASKLRELAADDSVAYISPDRQVFAADDLTDSAIGEATARNMGLDTRANGIGVAVIDSGINDTHNDLRNTTTQSRVAYHQNFTSSSVRRPKWIF